MHTYRLREAMVGVCRDADKGVRTITLPAGAVLKIPKIAFQSGVQSNMVDAQWEDHTISVFVEDLKTRGDPVPQAGSAPNVG